MELDLDALQAQVESLSPEELREQLLNARTKAKVTQKKYYNPERAKALREKKKMQLEQMKAKAIELGLWDEIENEANQAAEEKLAEEASNQDDDE